MRGKILFVLSGSLLFQIIQLGCFPILIAQVLAAQSISSPVIGLMVAIPWISVLILGPLVPGIIRKFGSNAANLFGFLLTMIGIFLIITSEFLPVVAVSTICIGTGLIIRWVNCDTLVIELSEENASGRAIGIHEALMGLGLAVGPLLFAVASLDQVKEICLALAIIGQLAFYAGRKTDEKIQAAHSHDDGLFSFFKVIAIALIAAFVAGFIESSATALFPIHLGQFSFSLSTSAVLVSSFGFGGTLLQPPLGTLADKKGYIFAQLLCATVILTGCLILLLWPTNYWILLVNLFFVGGAVGGLNTLAVMEAGKTLGEERIPSAMTAIAMLYTLGGIVGPIGAASSIEKINNFGMVLLFGGISLLFSIILFASLLVGNRDSK